MSALGGSQVHQLQHWSGDSLLVHLRAVSWNHSLMADERRGGGGILRVPPGLSERLWHGPFRFTFTSCFSFLFFFCSFLFCSSLFLQTCLFGIRCTWNLRLTASHIWCQVGKKRSGLAFICLRHRLGSGMIHLCTPRSTRATVWVNLFVLFSCACGS